MSSISEDSLRYLSPDSTNSTRKLGSSERRAARTQPAVPARSGDRLSVEDQEGRDNKGPASSHDNDVELRVRRDATSAGVSRGILEVCEQGRFLRPFRGPEDEEGGDDGEEGEVCV
jgi:hypothetical protein